MRLVLSVSFFTFAPLVANMFLPTLVSLLLLSASGTVHARSCIAFDTNWNLLAFGLDGKDWNAGQQSTWTGSERATLAVFLPVNRAQVVPPLTSPPLVDRTHSHVRPLST